MYHHVKIPVQHESLGGKWGIKMKLLVFLSLGILLLSLKYVLSKSTS